MLEYGNILSFILLFVLIIESMKTSEPTQQQFCIELCVHRFGIEMRNPNWTHYLDCIEDCAERYPFI